MFGLMAAPAWAQPANDNFANATPLTGSIGTINGSTVGATVEAGEPFHYAAFRAQSVWFRWVAPASGPVTLDTIGSTYDTITALYQGNSVSTLTQLASDDDGAVTSAYPFDDLITFQAVGGAEYYIAVDGYSGASGTYVLNWWQQGSGPGPGPTPSSCTNPVVGPSEIHFTCTEFSVSENTPGFATITVIAGGNFPGPVTVDYFTSDGTAVGGTDYFPVANTLTFQPGQTSNTFTVQIQDNAVQNPNRTVLLTLANVSAGATLGVNSNAVLTIMDDETLPVVSMAGVFNFSLPVYVVTENETVRAPFPGPSINVPDRSPLGALVMVTRTGGAVGRVMVDVAVSSAFPAPGSAAPGLEFTPITNTLVFDDYQMSATMLVPVSQDGLQTQNGNKLINLTLLNPRPDPLEDPVTIAPTIGTPTSTIQILEVNPSQNAAGAPLATFSIERKTYRLDEYNPFDPFNLLGVPIQTNVIQIDVINPSGAAGSVNIETRSLYGFVLLDGSDYTDYANFEFPDTPFTDGFPGVTNRADYQTFTRTLNFGQGVTRQTVTLLVSNDNTVEFNEDIQLRLFAPNPPRPILNPLANVTIMYDDQPAGQADREWNPEGISATQPPFNATPGANNIVSAVAVQADGRTVLVGDFTSVNSVSRFRIARMNVDGSLDLSFNPGTGADGFVEAVAIYPVSTATGTNAGKILVAGGFSTINNVSRRGLARLNANGSLDNSFYVGNGADGFVHTVTFQNDGKVLVTGDFAHWNDVPVPGIMRLNQDGSLDATFNPGLGPDNTIWSVSVRDTAQTIFAPRDAAGTQFEDVNVIETGAGQGTLVVNYDFLSIPDNIRVYYEGNLITDLTTNGVGQLTIPFGPGLATEITIILNQGIGLPGTAWAYTAFVTPVVENRTIYIGGDFTSYNGVTRHGVARLLDDGSLDQSFNPGLGVDGSGSVFAVAVQPDNKLMVGGSFTRFHTSDRNSVVRLRNDGSLDPNFNVGSGFNDSVYCITLQPDNKALFGGVFQEFNGVRRMGMARLMANGSLDTSFMDTAYNQFAGLPKTFSFDAPRYVNSIALQADGNLMIGGSFTNLGGNFSVRRGIRNNYTVFTRADKTTRFNIARIFGGYTPGPGNMEYDPAAFPFTIDENAGVFYATMRRVDGRLGTAQLIATNFANTAGTDDFFNQGLPMIWPEFAYAAPRSVGYPGVNYFAIPITEDILQEGDETFNVATLNPVGSILLGGEVVPLGAARGYFDSSTVTVADNDFSYGEFNFHLSGYITNENAGFAVITVIRTNGTSGSVSVDYLTRPGFPSPATTNADFTPVRGTLSFAAGQTVRTFNVPIRADEEVEFDETIALVLTNATGGAKLPGGTATSVATATLTIIDDDFQQGRLNFAFESFTNNENDSVATVIVTRTGGNVGAMTVQVRTGNGTAGSPADYTATTNTLSWSDGDSSAKTFLIPLVLDGIVEGPETVNLFLFNPGINGALGGRTNATLVIEDADRFGAVSFSQALYEVDENGISPTITVVRSGGIAGTVTVSYATAPLSALPGTDYNDTAGTLTFLPGETSHTFVVPLLDDSVSDGDKSILLSLFNVQNGTLGVLSNAILTAVDNESINIPAGSIDTTFNPGGANDAIYALALQEDGRIIIGGDFTLVNNVPRNRLARLKAPGTLDDTFNIGPGANGPIRALALQRDGKLVIGGLFTVINSTNRNSIARLAADGSLDAFFNPGAGADNPVFALAIQGDDKILAGGSFSTFNGIVRPGIVRLNTNGAVDLNFVTGVGVDGVVYAIELQADGKILIGGEFTAYNGVARTNLVRLNPNGTLDNTFNPTLHVNAGVRAILVQPDGRIVIGGSFNSISGVARARLARLQSNGTLDTSFLAGLSGADDTVFAVERQVDGRLLVAGAFKTFNGVTRNGITRLRTDGTTDPAINFGTGANAFVAALAIQPDRRIVLAGGFTEFDGVPRQYITRIYGGSIDGAGSLEFSRPVFVASESGTNATVTVRRRFGNAGEVRVDAFTQNGSAAAGVDYVGVTNTLVFPEGETRQSFTVPILPNTVPNDGRTVLLGLANFVGAIPGPQPVATLIIEDDDPMVTFSSENYVVNENVVNGNATITIQRFGGTNQAVSVAIATVLGGTATPGSDYATTNATVTFAVGETNKLFNVRVFNDTLLEGTETILLALSNPSVGTALGVVDATINLVDDELPNGEFRFATNNFVIDESGGSISITIERVNGSIGIVSVRLTTSDLTATAGADYTPTNRVITFADGETNKSVSISIVNDSVAEADETVALTLSQPTGGAVIINPGSILTIKDDEIVPSYVTFLTNNFYFDEDAGVAVISVVRTNSRRGFLTVDFSVSNGTAVTGVDYFATNGTLTFVDGVDLQTFTLPLVNDSEGEAIETVLLSLSNLQGTNAFLTGTSSTLNIVDDDSALRFSSATYTVAENGGSAVITVERVGLTNTPVSVTYLTTANGTAIGGVDYVAVSGELTWAAGETNSKTFVVPILDDNVLDGLRTVVIALTNPVGGVATIGVPGTAVLNITDDETQVPLAGPVDPTFNGNFGANNTVFTLAYDVRERLYIGGAFTQVYGLAVNRVARLETNGAVDITFDPGTGADAAVYALARGSNSLYVAGAFTNLNGATHRGIARLSLDGSVDVAFNPGTGANGTVFAAATLTGDQVVIGGQFTTVDGAPAPRLTKLNADGTLDTAFSVGSGPNGTVRALVVQTNGQIIIGGEFTSVNGFLLTRLARLNPNGVVDTSFGNGLGADGTIRGLALQQDGKVVVVGDFQTINGSPRNGIARLNADGSVDFSFDPGTGANGIVRSVVVQPDGKVVFAGDFTEVAGTPANRIARLNANGSIDNTFGAGTGANAPVHALALANVTSTFVIPRQASGTDLEDRFTIDTGANSGLIIIDYDFLGIDDNIRVYYDGVRLLDLTTNGVNRLVIPFGPGASTLVTVVMNEGLGIPGTAWSYTLTIETGARLDNRIALGGDFTMFDGQPRGRIAVIESTGTLYPGFDPRNISTRSVYSMALNTNNALPALNGRLIVGGDFTAIVGVNGQNRVARLNIDGTLDRTFNTGAGFNNTVRATAVQPDGKVIVGGLFTSYDFIGRSYLARLNADGTLDNTFNFANNGANLNNPVHAVALQADGKVVIGGAFTMVYGAPRNAVARMNTNGTVDVSFNPGSGANGAVNAVAIQADGKILIGGDFTTVGGLPRARIARLNTNGTVDTSFNPGSGANGVVNAIAITSAGEILVGGSFTSMNGTPAPRMARLTSSGAVDATFSVGSGANDYVSSIVVQPDGLLLVGGNFTGFNGQIRNRLVRLNSNGSLDPTINFGTGANDFISSIVFQNYDGKIIVGGGFTAFDGLPRVAVARLMGGTNGGSGTFHFSAPAYFANEGGGNAVVLVERSGGTLGAASVNYSTVNGTATAPGDFTAVSGTLNFADAESVKQILIPIGNNGSVDGDRDFSVVLSSPSPGSSLGVPSNAVVTIRDNDSVIGFDSIAYLVNEGAAVARITVTRTGGVLDAATVEFRTQTNGTAAAGLDYIETSGVLTFPAGVRSRTFDVQVVDDALNEFDETVPLTLLNATGPVVLGQSSATLTIVENDFSPGVITFGSPAYVLSEDGGFIAIEVLRTNGHSGSVSVNYQTLTGTATPNVDYVATNGVLTFVDGQTNAFLIIYAIDDSLTEGNETVPLQLFLAGGGATLGLADATLTIADNDAPGTFVFSSPTYSVTENGGSATITVIRTNGNIGGVSVTVQTSGGTATANGDYTPVPPTVLTFGPGQTVRTFTIPIGNDGLAEGTETVGLLLSNPTGNTSIGTPGVATLSIIDDETTVGFSAASYTVTESLTNVSITLVRGGDTNSSFSVIFTTSDGTATGSDYAPSTTTVTFAPGELTRVVTVGIFDDTLAEGDETVNLTLSSPSGGVTLGPIATAVLTIVDNDTGYNFSTATYSTNEGNLNIAITVYRLGFQGATSTVNYTTFDSSATAGADYQTSFGLLTFQPGQTSAVFSVTILDDQLVEGDEVVLLALTNPSAGTFLGPQATAVLSILDNDTTIGLAQTSYVVNEKAGVATITLIRQGASAQAVSVNFRTQNGSAVAGSDYGAVNGIVQWAAGDTAPKTVNIPIFDDGPIIEGSETVLLILATSVNALLDPASSSGVLTIVDNAGVIAFASSSYSVVEGSGNALLNLVRTGGSNGTVSVQWNVIGGTASPLNDYSGTVGTVVFAPGETVKPILLPIGEDSAPEGIETVLLTLSNAGGGASIGSPSNAVMSILDNDAGIIIGAGVAIVAESLNTNNVIEPNETVTVLFALRNAGVVDAGNVTAGLVFANGVTNTVPQIQNYGLLAAGGNSVSRPFTFTALGTNGSRITATLMITNDGLFLGPVSFDFVLGRQNIPFRNAGVITIPSSGQATPYPAPLTVSGVAGPVNKLTVTLHNMNHTYPLDLDILLVAPNGASVMLMSDAGTNSALVNRTITFDDAAQFAVPQMSPITNGTYRCANYALQSDTIPPFTPGTVWNNTSLATFNGMNPNGTWLLYVFDDATPDGGSIQGGWSLNIDTSDPIIPGSDLAVVVRDTPDPVTPGGAIIYTVGVTNYGPAAATSVTLTNFLPFNANFISSTPGGSLLGNVLTMSLGNIPAFSGTAVTVTMTAPNAEVQLTYEALVGAGTTDLNTGNNFVSVKTAVANAAPLPLLFAARKNNGLVLSWQSTDSSIVVETTSQLTTGWSALSQTPVVSNGVSTVTVPMDAGVKFYRLKRVP